MIWWVAGTIGVAFATWAFVGELRAMLRWLVSPLRRQRLCPHCGADIARETSAHCTDCGAAIRCHRCNGDITTGTQDVCLLCGASWTCEACGTEQKNGPRSPCPTCGAHAVCAGCSYDLTGSVSDRCPECGTELPHTPAKWNLRARDLGNTRGRPRRSDDQR